jgi:hypothetical protein
MPLMQQHDACNLSNLSVHGETYEPLSSRIFGLEHRTRSCQISHIPGILKGVWEFIEMDCPEIVELRVLTFVGSRRQYYSD